MSADSRLGLSSTFDERVEPAFAGIDHVVMLDYPNHGNVGDDAIWLGELAYLRQQHIAVDHVSDIPRYSQGRVRHAMRRSGGAIMLHGGGNFGDIYPKHQAFRELVARNHPESRIIQMPQSLHFDNSAKARLPAALVSHPDFHMFARDTRSHELARDLFGRMISMAPDAAHKCLLPVVGATQDVVVLARRDSERITDDVPGAVDWVTNAQGPAARWNRTHRRVCRRYPPAARFGGAQAWTWERLASQHVQRGCLLIGSGRTIVTDRLHAMLLGLALDRQVIAVENRIGKLGNYSRTWGIGQTEGLTFATSFAAAAQLVRQRIGDGSGQRSG